MLLMALLVFSETWSVSKPTVLRMCEGAWAGVGAFSSASVPSPRPSAVFLVPFVSECEEALSDLEALAWAPFCFCW